MAGEFHNRHGRLVFMSNSNKTARRRNPGSEFNHGLIFSKQTLKQDEIFQIRVDRVINSWSGSMSIGVTTTNPSNIEIPASASGLKNGYWIMSGVSVIKDGVTILDNYGKDLNELTEGDLVGISRRNDGSLHFYVNGEDLGIACTNLPPSLYAVVDLYGKCVEVSSYKEFIPTNVPVQPLTASILFHPHCGSLVKLSNNYRTAERISPDEEFKNSVVLTNKPLENDKVFEIKVEKLTDIWEGSLEVGITTHNPSDIVLPPTMTMMPSGTWIWSATSIIINGKEVTKDYSDVSLESIKVGDTIGIMRSSTGCLHFFLNGINMGLAVKDIPDRVYGIVDLYGAAVQTSICGVDDVEEDCPSNEGATCMDDSSDNSNDGPLSPLSFHPRCGMAVKLTNKFLTALRPRALEEFNHAVALTNRPLKPGELFEVYVDQQVDKWAGSLEIGLTTHNPETLELPSTMTNLRNGTWIMSGGGMVKNGSTEIEDYGKNLDDLKPGDRVGVIYQEDGTLNFYVNGDDMGKAANDVPPNVVYGFLDLYGRSAQATITNGQPRGEIPDVSIPDPTNTTPAQTSTSVPPPQESTPAQSTSNENWFTLSERHGDQVAVSQDCRAAVRINPLVEFNNAIVMSNRPLKDDEMFEVIVMTLVDRWSGSLEAGVTSITPSQLSFPTTMTDLDHDTWMLSGSSVLQDGITIQNGYACDLDKLKEGDRLGMMRKSDSTLHFFVNGEDCGIAASSVPSGIHAIIDLYGRCVELAVYDEDFAIRSPRATPSTQGQTTAATATTVTSENDQDKSCVPCAFHPCCGRSISLLNSGWTAARTKGFSDGLLFSAKPLKDDEIFEIKVDKLSTRWSGSLAVGVTSSLLPMSNVPSSADQLRDGTWLMVESRILKDGMTVKENYGSSLDRLQVGTRIGLQKRRAGTLHIYMNGVDQGVAATDVPRMVFGLVDLYGVVETISIISQTDQTSSGARSNIENDQVLEAMTSESDEYHESSGPVFTRNCGQHVRLDNKRMLARRVASYNHGVVVSDGHLHDNVLFQIRVTKLDIRWSGSLMMGITDQSPDSLNLSSMSNCMKVCPWIVVNNAVYINGNKVFESLEPGFDKLSVGDTVGMLIDKDSRLHIFINGKDQGVVAEALPSKRYVVVDLYGSCQEICIVPTADQNSPCEIADGNKAAEGLEQENKGPCDYRLLCERFKSTLALPDGYFSQESKLTTCYCQGCHEARGEKRYEISGDPARRYAQPLGWCQFGLGLPPRIKSLQVLDKWHVAFYATQIGKIRRILDAGDLPMPDTGQNRRQTKSNSNKENEVPRLVVSPTVMCVTCTTRISAFQYRDVTTGEPYKASVAFRVCVRPGSYNTGRPSCCSQDTNEAISDQDLGTEDLEWYLQEKGLVALTALLIKLEPT